ncbi:MAG: hypothetical protein JW936_00685 [Sedimentisphaerales bacterium]|nr:hypothetical protein [Sedimentisphaerales bacterium]
MSTQRIHANIFMGVLAMSAVILSVCATAQGQENDNRTIGITIDNTYASKYIWNGFDVYDDHAVYFPSFSLDLFQSGFDISVLGAIPMGTGSNLHEFLSDGVNKWQEWCYTVNYSNSLFADEIYRFDYKITYLYCDFVKINSWAMDSMQIITNFSMPNLISLGDLAIVPSYTALAVWPAESGGDRHYNGWAHKFGLSTNLITGGVIPGTEGQFWVLSWDITYNDGILCADHDWSHMTFGIAAPINFELFNQTISVAPFLNYQISMDDSVNNRDDLYGGVSVTIAF